MADLLSPDEIHYRDFEPKLKNRFMMFIDEIPYYIVKAGNRPSIQFNPITLDHINMKRKILGKGEWQDISLTLYDPINPSGAQAVIEWIRRGYESVTGRAGYSQFYKKDIVLNMIGPPGDIVEEWTLKGAFVTSADWGSIDWSDDSPAEITIQVAYDYAVLSF